MNESADCCSLHAVRLSGPQPSFCARIERAGDSAVLTFASISTEDQICPPEGRVHGLPPLECEPARMAAAVRWILDLDTHAKQAFLEGAAVSRAIPLQDPRNPGIEDGSGADQYWSVRRSSGELIRPLLLPAPSEDHLFPYQVEGVDWLMRKYAGILADDMGLGKTLQAITAIRLLVGTGMARYALVVCPKTLLANWEAELAKWAPELSQVRVTPRGGERASAWAAIVGRVHVLITNYEQLRDPPTVLRSRGIPILVADEAHKVRNLQALITKGIRTLDPEWFWALTGTPIERDTEDLATLLSTMAPSRFSRRDAKLPPGVLRSRTKPYLLRRLKRDILDQLPEVIESVEVLDLLPAQRRAYETALSERDRQGGAAALLALINRLRTICDFDPATGQSIKADRITEILENVRDAGEKAVVFSYLLEPLHLLKERVGKSSGSGTCVTFEGSMDLAQRERALTSFQTDERAFLLLASSRIASEGLTLTEANHVIFFNEWWNPSANEQARDRVVRIGQRRGVLVYKFRCRKTIEEELAHILEQKRETFARVIDQLAEPGLPSTGELSTALKDLEAQLHLFGKA